MPKKERKLTKAEIRAAKRANNPSGWPEAQEAPAPPPPAPPKVAEPVETLYGDMETDE